MEGQAKGRVQGNRDGSGFFIPEDGGEDLYLSSREMESLFDGDIVLARASATSDQQRTAYRGRTGRMERKGMERKRGTERKERKAGTVVEILQRRHREIVGRYYKESNFGLLVPDSKRINHEIIIPKGESANATDGQFVVAEITHYPKPRNKAAARITEVLGDIGTPGVEIEIALRHHEIPHEFPKPVKQETAQLPDAVNKHELNGRTDLRQIPFVTIDGEDAKDFDDAVYVRREQSGFTLFVAIADVSHYVRPGKALDEEAERRGTSVYFPGHVVPMLPEQLSNGLCSLRPNEDRLTLVAEIDLSADGNIKDFRFYEAVIHSHARLSYNEVADMVQPPVNATGRRLRHKIRKRYEPLLEHLDNLHETYSLLNQARRRAGALDFDTVETRIVFGNKRKIREIIPVVRNDAHRLIEECMLCANICAARLFEELKLPALYRIHEGPNPDKLEDLREYLGGKGLFLSGGANPDISSYAKLMAAIADRPDRQLLHTMLIRSMMQAVYRPDNVGHFGLGFPAYAHFTSPIRRYPDLLVHRAIRYLIRNKQNSHLVQHPQAAKLAKDKIYPYPSAELAKLGTHCSMTERRADAAGYQVQDWLKCEYMKDKVGDEYTGTVTAVTNFGLFVELTDIYIEGLVHVTELSNDYYHFDSVHHILKGERRGQVYGMGDTVNVKVVRVDIEARKIDLAMVDIVKDSGTIPASSGHRSR